MSLSLFFSLALPLVILGMKPPLKFFLKAIAHKAWSDVSIITSAMYPRFMNPTYAALETLNGMGLLGPNVVLHNVRVFQHTCTSSFSAHATL